MFPDSGETMPHTAAMVTIHIRVPLEKTEWRAASAFCDGFSLDLLPLSVGLSLLLGDSAEEAIMASWLVFSFVSTQLCAPSAVQSCMVVE